MAKKQFKAESKRLLDLMINSIYTHKEIFLREIISNSSDAIDKLCYLSLTDDKVGMNRGDFRIRVRADCDAGTITVSDNGIGMDEETQQNIFYKFYQGDKSHTTAGNGLGLSIVKKIVDMQDGKIEVSSQPGKGSTFVVTLAKNG